MSEDENRRTARNSISDNSSVMENMQHISLDSEAPANGGSGTRSRTQSESDTADSGPVRRTTTNAGPGGKQTPNNLNLDTELNCMSLNKNV